MRESTGRQITADVFQVGGPGLTAPQDAAVYLVCTEGSAALIDSGCGYGHPELLKNIRACGVAPSDIEYLLLTHCHFDHTGGAKRLRDQLECRVVAHELDAHFIEQGDDRVTAAAWYGADMPAVLVDEKIRVFEKRISFGGREITAIHTPGHSPGSLVYVTTSEGLKVLFAQDVHGPLHPDLLSDPQDYRESLRRLVAMEADVLCEGHFGVFMGKDAVRHFIESYLEGATAPADG